MSGIVSRLSSAIKTSNNAVLTVDDSVTLNRGGFGGISGLTSTRVNIFSADSNSGSIT